MGIFDVLDLILNFWPIFYFEFQNWFMMSDIPQFFNPQTIFMLFIKEHKIYMIGLFEDF